MTSENCHVGSEDPWHASGYLCVGHTVEAGIDDS